ncbi:MAG: 50S ribosomal protein L18 [Clostridiales bacterium GWF2_38_85]|nr:MAG: 50S ribosomal protein L18 [Clostridiales bacterium GWF2_38_85]HBL84931.1 50S ribosomal protein L18 [Clostridiales bacterium]
MFTRKNSNQKRLQRHKRVRGKITGTASKPRLCVYRSLDNIQAQIINDTTGSTLVSASSYENALKAIGGNIEGATKVGELVAKRAIEKGIVDVVFDRGGYLYHGRVKGLADGARAGGLKF